jgi:hypothetical protein
MNSSPAAPSLMEKLLKLPPTGANTAKSPSTDISHPVSSVSDDSLIGSNLIVCSSPVHSSPDDSPPSEDSDLHIGEDLLSLDPTDWDDSALIEAWETHLQAFHTGKLLSNPVKNKTKEQQNNKYSNKRKREKNQENEEEIEENQEENVENNKKKKNDNSSPSTSSFIPPPFSFPPGFSVPSSLPNEDSLANLLLTWYSAGFATGQYYAQSQLARQKN